MSNKIIQSDNAVIDYTTISVMIDTLNSQQKAIEDLQATVNHTSSTVDPVTGQKSTSSGPMVMHGGWVPITKNGNVDITYSGFNAKPSSVIGVVQSTSNPKNAGCYINKTITQNGASFTVYGLTSFTGANLYWMALGN
jgi:hypothetical protein